MHTFTQLYYPFPPVGLAPEFMNVLFPILILAAIWTIVLKGFALWYSSRAGQKWWFIVLIVVNTLGLLEIVYLIWFRPQKMKPVDIVPTEAGTSSPTVES